MAGKGGYQAPNNPAPVSGPGQLSRRTDGGPGQPIRVPTGGSYGDAQQIEQLQQSAPLAQSPGGAGGLLAGLTLPEGVGFDQGTQQPGTPITDGAALGPGAGPESLGLTMAEDEDTKKLVEYLPVWEMMANQPGSSRATRNLVRQLKAYAAQQQG